MSTTHSHLSPRTPYRGSCHCGLIKYIIHTRLPTPTSTTTHLTSIPARHAALAGSSIYKCNCSTCHKTGTFHLRLADAPGDFAVLAPLDGKGLRMEHPGDAEFGVREYRCFSGLQRWYFCGRCGVRTFCIKGDMELATIRLRRSLLIERGPDGLPISKGEASETVKAETGGDGGGKGEDEEVEVTVYRPVREGWKEPYKCYLSVNMVTLDQRQEGLDLRALHEGGWVLYCDFLEETGKDAATPFVGGLY